MQWHVHGTDAATGRRVTLEVEHAQATGAVQAAMSKRILVEYVTGGRWRNLALPLAAGGGGDCDFGGGVHGFVLAVGGVSGRRREGLAGSLTQANGTVV